MVSGSCVSSASSPPCGIENGLWLKSIFFGRPRPTRTSGSRRSSRTEARPRRSGPAPGRPRCAPAPANFADRVGLAGDEEHRVAVARRRSAPSSLARRSPRSGTWRSGPSAAPPSSDDVAQARRPRPAPSEFSLSKKLARLAAALGARIARTTPPAATCSANALKSEPAKTLGDVDDPQRVAQVGLVGAVLQHRLADTGCAGTATVTVRGSRRCANSSNTPASTGSMAANTSSCVDEAHLEVELVELAGRAVGAGVLVAEAGRDLEVAVEARRPSAAA